MTEIMNGISYKLSNDGRLFHLEKPLWPEEMKQVFGPRLVENPGFLPAGCIELRYRDEDDYRASEHAHVICANEADDFMERYRAAHDEETRTLLLVDQIRGA